MNRTYFMGHLKNNSEIFYTLNPEISLHFRTNLNNGLNFNQGINLRTDFPQAYIEISIHRIC